MHEILKVKKTFAHSTFLFAKRECASAFLHQWTWRFLLATKTCCVDLMETCLKGAWSDLTERWSTVIVIFIYFYWKKHP